MEKETVVIKINDTAYIGYKADALLDMSISTAEGPVINPDNPPAAEYINADEVRF